MTTNELITLLLSGAALIVSLVTLYLTYFHKSAGLIAVLISQNHEAKGKYKHAVEYTLSNTGNLKLILRSVTIFDQDVKDLGGYRFNVIASEAKELPCTIDPGQILLVTLGFDWDAYTEARAKGRKCLVDFRLYSSRGETYSLRHELDLSAREGVWRLWEAFTMGRPE